MFKLGSQQLHVLCGCARARHLPRVVATNGFAPTDGANYGIGGTSPVPAWVVNATPTLTFTSPSEEGSDDDFATTQLNNPWDMNAVSDFDLLTNLTNPHIESLALETAGRRFARPADGLPGNQRRCEHQRRRGRRSVCGPALRQRPRIQHADRYQPLSHPDLRVRRTRQAPRHSQRLDCTHCLAGERRVRRKRQRRHHFQQPFRGECPQQGNRRHGRSDTASRSRQVPPAAGSTGRPTSRGSTSSGSTRTNSIGRRTFSSSASSWRRSKRRARRTRFAGPSANRAARSTCTGTMTRPGSTAR